MKLRELYEQLRDLLHGLDYLFVSHTFYTTRTGEIRESIRINFDQEAQSIFLLPAILSYCSGIQGLCVNREAYEITIEPEV